MTRLEIEAFLTIIKCGSISAAAERLFVTQSALSRRVKACEEELGYELFFRGRGLRNIRLTSQGKQFAEVAEKFLYLYKKTEEIGSQSPKPVLHLAAVNSVATYLLPGVVRDFLKEEKGCNLAFHSCHSVEAYEFVESGIADVALVSDVLYSRKVITFPVFREPFVLAGGERWRREGAVKPVDLSTELEVRLPWNPEYDIWHERWFENSSDPNVVLDQMALLEECLNDDNWAVVPLSVALGIKREGIFISPMDQGPEDRTIYCLMAERGKEEIADRFLRRLHQRVEMTEGMESLLGKRRSV